MSSSSSANNDHDQSSNEQDPENRNQSFDFNSEMKQLYGSQDKEFHWETPSAKQEPRDAWVDTDMVSGLRLKYRTSSVVDQEMKLLNCEYIPVHSLDAHASLFYSTRIGTKPLSEWATKGVVERIICREKFSVLKVTNLRGHYFHLFLFGNAFRKHRQLKIGNVLCICNPVVTRPTQLESAVGLYVSDPSQLSIVGTSMDLAQCVAFVGETKQCDAMIDSRAGEFCDAHIKRAFGLSRNTRMELASGTTGLDVCWIQKQQTAQGTLFKATSRKKKSRKEDSYIIENKGTFTSDGIETKIKLTPTEQLKPKNEAELREFLKGKSDPGAEMIRRLRGIEETTTASALSKEAMAKMGMSRRDAVTKEDNAAKKRSIDALLAAQSKAINKDSKKPRYIDL
ncbi:hypothetical protein CLU79DRAFT_838509 [Phycomyces nitens]|nr:hypothetical protein CLU79DRAFT_838509 [Phycomyces nitens]